MSDADDALLVAWAAREATAADRLTTATQSATGAAWATFGGWYDSERVADLAARTAVLSQTARAAAGNLGVAYMREVLAGLRAVRVAPVRLDLPDARLGADPTEVYARPAEAYRSAFSTTGDPAASTAAAIARLNRLIADDVLIARRDGEHQQMRDAGVEGYRRIVHPELSEGGVCGLCLAASDRVYSIADLMPIHARCRCTTAPIVDGYDPHDIDLEAVYAAAGGSTDGRELKRTRYQVNEHGELGPVLSVRGERFQRQGEAPKGDPVERARRELAVLEPVLVDLETRAASGANLTGPLTYQRDRISKLRAITAA